MKGLDKRVKRMPRPKAEEAAPGDATPNRERLSKSPLGVYLKVSSISLSAFARCIGVNFITVQQWAYGEQLPGLVYAAEVERVTKGVVPIEAWLGLPQAKKIQATIREQQPDEVRNADGAFEPGGFAKPMPGGRGTRPMKKDDFLKGGGDDDL